MKAQENRTSPPIPFHVLIAAAGKGTRLGQGLPKQYIPIFGQTLLRRSVKIFLDCPGIQSLRVIIDPQDADLAHDALKGLEIDAFINGGETRKESVFKGLESFSDVKNKDIIMIHDAARPFVTHDLILKTLEAAQEYKAATAAIPIVDTIRDTQTSKDLDRSALYSVQTPQAFHYDEIIKAHHNAAPDKHYTDDTSLLIDQGKTIHYIQGDKANFKITTTDDLDMAKIMIAAHYNDIRTGLGFDVHAFDPQKDGPVRLCGIDIPHNHALKGHSDADVGLHAITDAILGTIGAGDIGQHFPPSDDTYKDMDSAIFLEKAHEILTEKNGILKNIDITIICEAPKIGPYAPEMRQHIAEILNLDETRINIKATTSERLGFTGRGEGIAAQAIATIGVKA